MNDHESDMKSDKKSDMKSDMTSDDKIGHEIGQKNKTWNLTRNPTWHRTTNRRWNRKWDIKSDMKSFRHRISNRISNCIGHQNRTWNRTWNRTRNPTKNGTWNRTKRKKKRTRIRHEFRQKKNGQEFFRSVFPTVLGPGTGFVLSSEQSSHKRPPSLTPGTFFHKGRSKAIEFSCADEFINAKMPVIGCCENRLLADHQRSIFESVSGLSLSCKDSLFALFEPYFRSSVTNSGTHKRKVSLLNTDWVSKSSPSQLALQRPLKD